ncbi:MAG: fatty acid desaturase family protein [Pseudomonadota bacterium]
MDASGRHHTPPVARARPAECFSPADWASLQGVSRWKGLALVAHAWAIIAAALAAAVIFPNPLVWLLAIVVVGARQHGLAILTHEAAHGLLHPDKRVNDQVGRWLCAAPVGVDLARYRAYHLAHHRYTQTAADPDLSLATPFPITRASLRRKIMRDLTGRTFFKQRIAPLFARRRGVRSLSGDGAEDGSVDVGGDSGAVLFFAWNAGFLLVLAALGAPAAFVIWGLGLATWFPLALRLRNIAEHACAPAAADPFTHARTTRANFVERFFLAPYAVNYHAEHHLFMYLPCYALPRAHRLLAARGLTPAMHIAPSYAAVLRRVTDAASPRVQPA